MPRLWITQWRVPFLVVFFLLLFLQIGLVRGDEINAPLIDINDELETKINQQLYLIEDEQEEYYSFLGHYLFKRYPTLDFESEVHSFVTPDGSVGYDVLFYGDDYFYRYSDYKSIYEEIFIQYEIKDSDIATST
jgi:hypothetical protein